MLRSILKSVFMRGLFLLPHNNVYSFHCICDDPEERRLTGRWLEADRFRSFVKKHGPYLPLGDLLIREKRDGHAALTFDDGLRDVYTVAYPYLKQEGIPFTVFPLTGKLDQPGYLTTDQLKELAADPLVTVGSHGISHVHLSREDRDTQERELTESKRTLEALTGKPCDTAAYPFGHYNDTTLSLMRSAGYRWGMAVRGRPLLYRKRKKPYEVPRLSVDRTTVELYDRS